jgi:polyhydroxyalkanoate synthesis regulator phasin
MPQPRKGKTPAPAAPAMPDPTSLVELLTKGLLLTTDRIQAAMDDAVQRGRMTRDDAEDLVASLVEAGRKQTEEMRRDLEGLVGRSLDVAGDASRKAGDRLLREGDRARRVAGLAAFPISRYDDLTAAQILERIGDLSSAQLRKVRDYERRNGNRKTVLTAVEKQLASES